MLTHYIIVRKDLPLGVLAAMVTHAAGESAVLYQNPEDGRFRRARAVVLEAVNELALQDVSRRLEKLGIQRVEIVESGPIYSGELMAVGVVPTESQSVVEAMQHYLTLKG